MWKRLFFQVLFLCLCLTTEGQKYHVDSLAREFSTTTFLLIMNGKTELAMKRVDSALIVNPKNRDAIYLKLQIYQKLKDVDGIRRQIEFLLSIDTIYYREKIVFRGMIEEHTNSYKAALPYYQKAKTAKVKPIPAEYKDVNPIFIDYLIDNDRPKLKRRLVALYGQEEWERRLEMHYLVNNARKELLEICIGIRPIE